MAANSQFSMAVHVLSMLARAEDENLKSDDLAKSVNTNPVVIRRLLSQMSQAGLVISQTGANGGSRLSRRPEEISLAEIYKAVGCSGVFALHAKEPNKDCPVGKNIEAVLCCLQKEIDRSIEEKLARYTLQNVFELVEQGVPG